MIHFYLYFYTSFPALLSDNAKTDISLSHQPNYIMSLDAKEAKILQHTYSSKEMAYLDMYYDSVKVQD